jgi:hypothetical protein
MPRTLRLALVPLALTALLVSPLGADEAAPCADAETGELVLTPQQTYIHQAQTKAGNLAALGATDFPSWNTTAPTQSVQQGAGGGYAGNFALVFTGQDDAVAGLTLEGTFAGCVDTMLVELYAFLPTNRTGTSGKLNESPLVVYTSLEIDGETLLLNSQVETKTVPNTKGSATYRSRYAFTNIHEALLDFGLDPAAEHTIRVNATPRFANTNNAVFVYDTTEVPSGILFNGTLDATYTEVTAF